MFGISLCHCQHGKQSCTCANIQDISATIWLPMQSVPQSKCIRSVAARVKASDKLAALYCRIQNILQVFPHTGYVGIKILCPAQNSSAGTNSPSLDERKRADITKQHSLRVWGPVYVETPVGAQQCAALVGRRRLAEQVQTRVHALLAEPRSRLEDVAAP